MTDLTRSLFFLMSPEEQIEAMPKITEWRKAGK
jgi:hypothetical protein